MIRRPPRSTQGVSSAASDVYKRQVSTQSTWEIQFIKGNMKHLAAYALLVLGGKANPTEEEVTNVLKEVGIKADPKQLKAMIEALKGKKLHELIASGMGKIQTVSTGAAPKNESKKTEKKADKKEPKEEKKTVKKEEEKKEEDDTLGGGLNIFGDDFQMPNPQTCLLYTSPSPRDLSTSRMPSSA
eukprot:TRINITY_DN2087_c0_g1_i2.p1 TRINITY_DN2087_c0_g1~~TRINITY_DN2087_c0_g1_i2.p1  ORF type:complete len:185 (+),score=63.05 TRINITY_DN2087_c0_g1_i2:190-744(+)